MKITFSELMDNYQALLAVSNKTLPRKVSVAIARNIDRFGKELKLYDDQKRDIADRYAVKNKAGEYVLENNAYTFKNNADHKAFTEEVKELDKTEFEIDVMMVASEELDRCDMVERYDILTPREEAVLAWMIKYE